jgi:hypothetical protein
MNQPRKNMRSVRAAISLSQRFLERQDGKIVSYQSREDFWNEISQYAEDRAKDTHDERIAKNVERMNEARAAKKEQL